MIGRYAASAGLAAVVTSGLLFLMQSLIASGPARLSDIKAGRIVEFVRLKRESQIEKKERELPNRKTPEDEPPPPEMELSDVPEPSMDPSAMGTLAYQPSLDLSGGPSMASAASDADVVPLVRVSPQYPPDAMMRGVEGWVHVMFTISSAGTVKDVEVVDADPKGYFERAAMNAVKRYKYKPKVENGSAVERPGVEVVLSFKLER